MSVAHCTADAAGTVVFELAGPAGTDLVLRRRGGATPADEVRLPVTGPRAVLRLATPLAEGRWDVERDGRPVRPGTRDLRALVDRIPGSGPVTVRVPYPTTDSRLALRSWVRAPHAEAGAIHLADGAMTVHGVLYGAEAGDGATAEARRCEDGPEPRTRRVPVTGGAGGAFTFTLPYATLAEPAMLARQLWDLWLRPAHDAAPVRLSRILDDVWDRKSIYVYPAHRADGWRAAPCYSGDNDLRVRLDPGD